MASEKNVGKKHGIGVTTKASFAQPNSHKHIAGGPAHHRKMKRRSGKGLMH